LDGSEVPCVSFPPGIDRVSRRLATRSGTNKSSDFIQLRAVTGYVRRSVDN